MHGEGEAETTGLDRRIRETVRRIWSEIGSRHSQRKNENCDSGPAVTRRQTRGAEAARLDLFSFPVALRLVRFARRTIWARVRTWWGGDHRVDVPAT